MKRIHLVAIVLLSMTLMSGCSSTVNMEDKTSQDTKEVTIAYQPSVGYAPLIVMKEKRLLEQNLDNNISVKWIEMKNGAEINEALISGDIDVGTMGVPVAVTGVMAGSPYKIAFGLSSQPYSILTSSDNIRSLSDITSEDKIAITNINSQPHILLAMAAKAELGDAHALDNNLTKLSNSDGFTAMLSGAVHCHMVISPFNFMEIDNNEVDIHEIPIDNSIWPRENTALVGVVTEKFKNENQEIYEALIKTIEVADEYIKNNPHEVAEILSKDYDAGVDNIEQWITDDRSSYDTTLHGIMDMCRFMADEGFIDNCPSEISELVYEGVLGE